MDLPLRMHSPRHNVIWSVDRQHPVSRDESREILSLGKPAHRVIQRQWMPSWLKRRGIRILFYHCWRIPFTDLLFVLRKIARRTQSGSIVEVAPSDSTNYFRSFGDYNIGALFYARDGNRSRKSLRLKLSSCVSSIFYAHVRPGGT